MKAVQDEALEVTNSEGVDLELLRNTQEGIMSFRVAFRISSKRGHSSCLVISWGQGFNDVCMCLHGTR